MTHSSSEVAHHHDGAHACRRAPRTVRDIDRVGVPQPMRWGAPEQVGEPLASITDRGRSRHPAPDQERVMYGPGGHRG